MQAQVWEPLPRRPAQQEEHSDLEICKCLKVRWIQAFPVGRSAEAKIPGVAGDLSGGEELEHVQFWEVPLGGSSVPQHLECASVQQPVGLRALGKGWLVRLSGFVWIAQWGKQFSYSFILLWKREFGGTVSGLVLQASKESFWISSSSIRKGSSLQ